LVLAEEEHFPIGHTSHVVIEMAAFAVEFVPTGQLTRFESPGQ
jgi:hypothetical protein